MHALGYTLGAFALILVLARLKVPLALAVFAGSAVIGAAFGLGIGEIGKAFLAGAIVPRTVALVMLTAMLLALSETMRAGGQLEQIVHSAKALLRRPILAMAVLPALVGLIPMPGGALFSAPMVETVAGSEKVGGARLSAINYWFRHIWEHWWPLYPGLILAVTLTETDLGPFILCQMPLCIGMVLSGLLILSGLGPGFRVLGPPPARGTKRKMLRAVSPIIVILLVWAVVRSVLSLVLKAGQGPSEGSLWAEIIPALERYLPIATGLLVSMVWTAWLNRLPARTVGGVLRLASLYKMALLVLSVMVFQHVMGVVEAPGRIAEELQAMHVPVLLVVAALPFIAGMVTGLAVGFVGTSFPIVLGLVAAIPGEASIRPFVALAYAFGHLGQMMSPLHLCHVMSNRYFKTSFAGVYRLILLPAVLTGAWAVAYFFLLRAILN